MKMQDAGRLIASLALLVWPLIGQAHSFGRIYNLPVPFWLYAWGSAAALIASFLVVGIFVTSREQVSGPAKRDISGHFLIEYFRSFRLLTLLQVLSVAGLLLCIATGLWGSRSPYSNFNMTFFWIVFMLGYAYLTAITGDLYCRINPWRVMAESLQKFFSKFGTGLYVYPEKLGVWPAVILYMAFIWIELFGRTLPYSLGLLLLAYSVINFIGVAVIGIKSWFRYCEFLSVFMRLLAAMAPIEIVRPDDGSETRISLRMPFTGLIDSPAEKSGLLVFILFMLSSTAFDGLRETIVWQKIYWGDLYNWKIQALAGNDPLTAFSRASQLFMLWQSFWLLLSPFIYLLVYLLFIWLMRLLTRVSVSVKQLSQEFAFSLLPIVLVYNITHYYTLIQSQGVKIVSLMSDPFGWGWNLFGTARWLQRAIIPDAGTVWHVQVGLIVLGHIVSVYVAHVVALRIFPTHRQAVISQIPMLFLMVIFTVAGLWILSQPVRTGA